MLEKRIWLRDFYFIFGFLKLAQGQNYTSRLISSNSYTLKLQCIQLYIKVDETTSV